VRIDCGSKDAPGHSQPSLPAPAHPDVRYAPRTGRGDHKILLDRYPRSGSAIRKPLEVQTADLVNSLFYRYARRFSLQARSKSIFKPIVSPE
jgi:hypothetical protein